MRAAIEMPLRSEPTRLCLQPFFNVASGENQQRRRCADCRVRKAAAVGDGRGCNGTIPRFSPGWRKEELRGDARAKRS